MVKWFHDQRNDGAGSNPEGWAMKKDMLQRVHQATNSLKNSSSNIKSIAKAFERIGNTKLSEELTDISKSLEFETDSIIDAIGDDLNRQLNESREDTAKTLKVLLNR